MKVNQSDRFAFYLRKSRADLELEKLGEMETLARHAGMLEQLARRHDIPMSQVEIYKEVVSGESIQDRPEMQRLLKAVSERKYKAVLVVEIERLARGNTSDQGQVADAFLYSNTLIITPSKVFNPRDPSDLEYFEFGLFMSRREYQTIRRRLQAGKLAAIKEGQYIANWVPYGYTAVRNGKKDRHLEVVPEEAEVVKRVFDLHQSGNGPGAIARELTRQGIKPPRNADQWHKSTITRMLHNPVYIGKIRWSAKETTRVLADDGRTVKRRVYNPEPILVDGNHAPIIDNSLWNAVNYRRISPPVKQGIQLVNPLAGLLKCTSCHRAITYKSASKKQPKAIYTHTNALTCQQKAIHADLLLEAITEKLKEILHDTEIRALEDVPKDETPKRKQAISKSLNREQQKLKKIYTSFESGIYSADEFITRRNEIQGEISRLQLQLEELNQKPKAPEPKEYVQTLHELINSLTNEQIPAAEKNKFLSSFIKVIWYENDGVNCKIDLVMRES